MASKKQLKEKLVDPKGSTDSLASRPDDLSSIAPDEDYEVVIQSDAQAAELMAGMTSNEAAERMAVVGPNSIPEKIVHWYQILGKQFTNSMAIMIELAGLMSACVAEWEDFGIILVMLLTNASIGFYEEWMALQKVQAIKSMLAPNCMVKRDGKFEKRPTADLVPGDVIFVRGGDMLPADVDYLEGDVMAVDTAALTGEPFPRKCPDAKGNRRTLAGCMVVTGNTYCLVQRTGVNTETGSATLLIQQSTKPEVSVFERSIIEAVEFVMTIAILFLISVFFVLIFSYKETVLFTIEACLAILIASVPVALPVVMQVTLALGAGEMAKQQAIVTHLQSMQEIASMTVLCSDKTGTLTTAKINVFFDQIWCAPGFTKDKILEWCALASNPVNEDDPIDSAILSSFKNTFPEDFDQRIKQYTVKKFVGFDAIVKRTVAYASTDQGEEIKVSKGLIDKILDTGDDGGDCWCCENAAEVRAEVERIDEELSKSGYKTLGVARGTPGGKMRFAGIVPMLDPPREDTKWVCDQIKLCGIDVKMITGDHQNIAKETARLVGLGTNILRRDVLANEDVAAKDKLVVAADGFAQVMPKDKNDCVKVLQALNYVVGMTGDGVNDAPALKQAHVGIAVEGSTDAARNAADIVLTTEGLSPIFTAVLESRKIFQRVYSYVLYRVSATIQIVLVLSILAYFWGQTIKPLYIIILALFNDITMITISYDNVVPSRSPEQPTINKLLRVACVFGLLMATQSLIFYNLSLYTDMLTAGRFHNNNDYRQSVMYMQISLSIEGLIFSTRTPGAPFYSSMPVPSLMVSVVLADVIVTLIVGFGAIGNQVSLHDIMVIWFYDAAWFVVIDFLKIPISMTVENYFPPPPSIIGTRTAESTAAIEGVRGAHGPMGIACVDIGYTYLSDTAGSVAGAVTRCVGPAAVAGDDMATKGDLA